MFRSCAGLVLGYEELRSFDSACNGGACFYSTSCKRLESLHGLQAQGEARTLNEPLLRSILVQHLFSTYTVKSSYLHHTTLQN